MRVRSGHRRMPRRNEASGAVRYQAGFQQAGPPLALASSSQGGSSHAARNAHVASRTADSGCPGSLTGVDLSFFLSDSGYSRVEDAQVRRRRARLLRRAPAHRGSGSTAVRQICKLLHVSVCRGSQAVRQHAAAAAHAGRGRRGGECAVERQAGLQARQQLRWLRGCAGGTGGGQRTWSHMVTHGSTAGRRVDMNKN